MTAFIKKNLSGIVLFGTILIVCFAFALYFFISSDAPLAAKARRTVQDILHTRGFPKAPNPLEEPGTASERLYDKFAGFYADFPSGTGFDFSKSPKFIRINGEGFTGAVSREWSVESDVSAYISRSFNTYILNERYQKENGIRLIEHTSSERYELVTVHAEGLEGKPDTYTYIMFKTGGRFFYRVMLKYMADNTDIAGVIDGIINSFYYFKPTGKAEYNLSLSPIVPENWSDETKRLYARITNSDSLLWGIFTEDVKDTGISVTIPAIEQEVDYTFDIVLAYAHLTEAFPMEFMRTCRNEGRLVELTYQLTLNDNQDLYARSPLLDMYRGIEFEQIREFARQAKAFGHPFLFRLNNEMNSTWTSYGGVNNLLDPDIFIDVWQTIYRIFQEEGVDNAIWVFNPNDRDFPPNNWNSQTAYFPGGEYVHMIGVTGYNTGTYYSEVFGERWREFRRIYDGIAEEYAGMYDKFPWIITEFASSSAGGNKAKWVERMFRDIKRYPNIKAAVWFSYADFDFRPGFEGQVARPYWMDETPQVLEAFRKGLN